VAYPNIKNKFPYISIKDQASDLIFCMHLGLAKAHHKIPPRRKSGSDDGLGELPKILESRFNISATAEGSDFKFGMQLGFAKAHHKIPKILGLF